MCKIWDDIRNEGIQEGIKKGEEKGEKIGIQKGEKIGLQKGEKIGLQKGEEIGIQKGVLISLKGVMRKYNLGLEEAMEAICIPEEGKEWVRKALEPSA